MRAGVGGCPRQPESPSDPTLGRAGTREQPALRPPASPGAGSGAGARGREEGRLGEFPRLSRWFHKSPQPRRRPSREVRGAGAQRGGTRHLPFPPPLSFFQFFFFFFKPPPLPPRSGGCPSAARAPLRLRWVPPPARPRSLRLAERGLRGGRARRLPLARRLSGARPARPGAGAAAPRDARRTAGAAPARGSRRQLGWPPSLPPAAGAR